MFWQLNTSLVEELFPGQQGWWNYKVIVFFPLQLINQWGRKTLLCTWAVLHQLFLVCTWLSMWLFLAIQEIPGMQEIILTLKGFFKVTWYFKKWQSWLLTALSGFFVCVFVSQRSKTALCFKFQAHLTGGMWVSFTVCTEFFLCWYNTFFFVYTNDILSCKWIWNKLKY